MPSELTKILDVVTPEVFEQYMSQYSTEKSAFIQSGVAVADPRVSANITAGGTLVNMPFWNDLNGDDETLDDGENGLSTGKITASKDIANVLYRGRGWSVNELAAVLSGDDPLGEVMKKIGSYWLRREQQVLMSTLNGLFAKGGPLANKSMQHLNIVDGPISALNVMDTKQLLGDASDKLSMIVMHSAVYTELQKQDLIQFTAVSQQGQPIPTYLGYRVVEDDALKPTSDGKYRTYLLAAGSFGRNTGTPAKMTSFETSRDAAKGNDNVFTRRAFVMHPYGVKWTDKSVAGETATNDELAKKENWEAVYGSKNIGIVALEHTITDGAKPLVDGTTATAAK
ncbi:major capsid protein [Fructobacillus tropaeoli]|uniref:Coat protein n=1 Tax=Fructobacillus tropaeoli TaxID=709323 RepID=A0A3F3HD91_9LACO|nr:hypothetical protein [Fructobacillus tropaeoli]GAP04890.1 coat protein [Fructobacillus tropaeoli]